MVTATRGQLSPNPRPPTPTVLHFLRFLMIAQSPNGVSQKLMKLKKNLTLPL